MTPLNAPVNKKKTGHKRNWNAEQLSFGKHNSYQRLNDFWKFVCDRIMNIEVIQEIISRVSDFKTAP